MSAAPKPFAFILMPFSGEFDDTYELAIKPACESAGAYAERVDKQIFSGSILERVYNQIAKADLLVADMSGKNANVFYEVGYAHALGKTTILLTRAVEDIPFDLKHYPHVVYNARLADLKRELEARIRWYLENPEKAADETSPLVVRVNGQVITNPVEIELAVQPHKVGYKLKVEVQNKIGRSIGVANFQIGLFTSSDFVSARTQDDIPNTDIEVDSGHRLCLNSARFNVLPEAWDSVTFIPCTDNREILPGEVHSYAVRIYRESGASDYAFSIRTVAE